MAMQIGSTTPNRKINFMLFKDGKVKQYNFVFLCTRNLFKKNCMSALNYFHVYLR